MSNWKVCTAGGFLPILLVIVGIPALAFGNNSPHICRNCHGNARRMQELGYSRFVISQQEVDLQTRMAAKCPDCHLGYPACGGNLLTRPVKKGGKKVSAPSTGSLLYQNQQRVTPSQDFRATGKICGICHRNESKGNRHAFLHK